MQLTKPLRVLVILPTAGPSRLVAPAAAVSLRQIVPSVTSSPRRYYATHRSTNDSSATPPPEIPNLGSQASNKHQFAESFSRVGPFDIGTGGDKGWKKWGELTGGGKLKRAGGQLGSFGVVLVGLTLLGAVGYALGGEVLGHDNPRRLYSDAIDLVFATRCLEGHLLPPIKVTHSPAITAPSRGTPPIVHQEIIHPVSRRKHMLVKFWVHGRGKDEPESFGAIKDLFRGLQKQAAEYGLAWSVTRSLEDDKMEVEEDVPSAKSSAAGSSWIEWLGLGSLTGLKTTDKERERRRTIISRKPPPAGTYKVGEVTADWVKSAESNEYYLLSLVVDMPSSAAAWPTRAVAFWSPHEADKESLIAKRP